MNELPIACTLGAGELAERSEFIARLRKDALIGGETTARGVRLRLRDAEDVERRARALIAAEAECCAFLDFSLAREGGALVLDISGPAEARPIVDAFLTG